MEAYTDASVPRTDSKPSYSNGFICCYLPRSGFVAVEEIEAWTDKEDTLSVGGFVDTCELAAIKLALSFGATHVFSDSKNAIRMAEILKFDADLTWIAGKKPVEFASMEETLIRVPHKFASANKSGRWIIKVTPPVGRDWIEIIKQI